MTGAKKTGTLWPERYYGHLTTVLVLVMLPGFIARLVVLASVD